MNKNKGFTLIEILATVIIMGIIMLIAVPAVTGYISDTRKEVYIKNAESYIESAARMIMVKKEITIPRREDVTFYLPIQCITIEEGGKSSYGDWQRAYVVITYTDGGTYKYYWASVDDSGKTVLLSYSKLLKKDLIVDSELIVTDNVGVGSRNRIATFSETVTAGSEAKCELPRNGSGQLITRTASRMIPEEGRLNN